MNTNDVLVDINDNVTATGSVDNHSNNLVDATIGDSDSDSGSHVVIDRLTCKREVLAPLEAIDVVGLDSNKHGRSCRNHDTCGRIVEVGDILFTRCELEVDYLSSEDEFGPDDQVFEELFDNATEKVQVYKVGADCMAHCLVGYLPKYLFYHFKGAYTFDKLYLRVVVDYRRSENSHERSRSCKNFGMCKTIPIWDDPDFDGRDSFNEHNPCVMYRMIQAKNELVQLPLPPPIDRKTNTRRRTISANNSDRPTTAIAHAKQKKKMKQQNVKSSNSKKKRRTAPVATKAVKRQQSTIATAIVMEMQKIKLMMPEMLRKSLQ